MRRCGRGFNSCRHLAFGLDGADIPELDAPSLLSVNNRGKTYHFRVTDELASHAVAIALSALVNQVTAVTLTAVLAIDAFLTNVSA